jgi:hypothetical protein
MNLDAYRDQFGHAIQDQLRAIDQSVQVFNTLLRTLEENDAELKRLILEQGQQLREQGQQIRELLEQLDELR